MPARRRAAYRIRVLVAVVVGLSLTLYFGQYLTAPPNSIDGALLLGYLHSVAEGERLHFDFFDYYGPFVYSIVSAFYAAAGKAAIGVNVYILLLKVASVGVAYVFAQRLAGRFYGAIAAVLVTALLGQPLVLLQAPYAAHLCFPVMLVTWLLLLLPAEQKRSWHLPAAGALTAFLLWTKVTQGAFTLAGALFHLFYFDREPTGSAGQSFEQKRAPASRALEVAGLVAYAAVFRMFISEHYGALYFWYLTLPLGLVLAAAAHRIFAERHERPPLTTRVKRTALYLLVTLAAWLAVWLAYFGPSEGTRYLAEQVRVLSRLNEARPFPAIGEPGTFGNFTRYYFPQLPWLVSLGFAAWLLLRTRPDRANKNPDAEASCAGAFALLTTNTFVIYARSDEAHLFVATVPASVVLCILVERLEQLALRDRSVRPQGGDRKRDRRGRLIVRAGFAAICCIAALSLVSIPRLEQYALGTSDWGSPRLRHLRYHSPDSVIFGTRTPERQLDIGTDAAARQLDALTQPGEEVLVLGRNQLLNFASDTRPVGGRYRHLFYLLREGVLDRKTFTELVPRSVLERLYEDPPRIMVDEIENRELVSALPELRDVLLRAGYRRTGEWGIFRFYERARPRRPAAR